MSLRVSGLVLESTQSKTETWTVFAFFVKQAQILPGDRVGELLEQYKTSFFS